jgi:hypothetical protein
VKVRGARVLLRSGHPGPYPPKGVTTRVSPSPSAMRALTGSPSSFRPRSMIAAPRVPLKAAGSTPYRPAETGPGLRAFQYPKTVRRRNSADPEAGPARGVAARILIRSGTESSGHDHFRKAAQAAAGSFPRLRSACNRGEAHAAWRGQERSSHLVLCEELSRGRGSPGSFSVRERKLEKPKAAPRKGGPPHRTVSGNPHGTARDPKP